MRRRVSATVSWTATPGDSYRLLYGTSPSNLSNSIDVGQVNTYRVGGLRVGVTYYFALTSRNASGESPLSQIIAYTAANRNNNITL